MEPGKDTDLAVAKACGISAKYAHLSGGYHCVIMQHEDGVWGPFSPSTDLNDAFKAADTCWDEDDWLLCSSRGNTDKRKYAVFLKTRPDYLEDSSDYHDAPSIAICAAILSRKPEQPVMTIYPEGAD